MVPVAPPAAIATLSRETLSTDPRPSAPITVAQTRLGIEELCEALSQRTQQTIRPAPNFAAAFQIRFRNRPAHELMSAIAEVGHGVWMRGPGGGYILTRDLEAVA